ncbi:MAG TPA: hypothetical protein DEF79_00960 [Gammaproteobacteria bacterium]|nr:hypothetical protein [Gammaproteobacteria bacterium]
MGSPPFFLKALALRICSNSAVLLLNVIFSGCLFCLCLFEVALLSKRLSGAFYLNSNDLLEFDLTAINLWPNVSSDKPLDFIG